MVALRRQDTICPRAEHGFAELRERPGPKKPHSLEKPQPGLWEPVPFWIILLPLGLGKGLLENDLTIERGCGSAQASVQGLASGGTQAPHDPRCGPCPPLGDYLAEQSEPGLWNWSSGVKFPFDHSICSLRLGI